MCFHALNEPLSSWTPERHFTLCSAIVLRRHNHVACSSSSSCYSRCSFSSFPRVPSPFLYQLPSTKTMLSMRIKLCANRNQGATLRSSRYKISTFQLLVLFAFFLFQHVTGQGSKQQLWSGSCDSHPRFSVNKVNCLKDRRVAAVVMVPLLVGKNSTLSAKDILCILLYNIQELIVYNVNGRSRSEGVGAAQFTHETPCKASNKAWGALD